MRPRSADEISRQMVQAIAKLDAVADATSGPIHDLAVVPQATQLAFLEALVAYASKLRSLGDAKDIDPADLDEFGATFGIERGLGSYARGTVSFERSSAPTSDITIPAGTVVGVPGTQLSYYTEYSVTMRKDLAATYYDATRNKWSVSAPIIATKPGSSYNVGSGKIRSLSSNISGIDGVYNRTPVTGGKDISTNTEFAQVLSDLLAGTDRTSKAGTSREVRRIRSEVVDVAVFSGSDAEIGRIAEAVPRDIYITGGAEVHASDSFTYTATGDSHILMNRPVVGIVGVYNTSTGNVYTQGTDYVLVLDQTERGGSIYASDAISIPQGSSIVIGTNLTVVYQYDTTVKSLQEYFLKDENKVAGLDTVVFRGKRKQIYVSISFTPMIGYSTTQIREDIASFLDSFINTGKFGDGETALSPSNIRIELLNSVNGISSMVFTRFSDGPSGNTVESILVAKNEYAYIDTKAIVWG